MNDRADRSAKGVVVGVGSGRAVGSCPLRGGLLGIFRSDPHETLWSAFIAFAAGAIALVVTTTGQPRKRDEELHGLVYGMTIHDTSDTRRFPRYNAPVPARRGPTRPLCRFLPGGCRAVRSEPIVPTVLPGLVQAQRQPRPSTGPTLGFVRLNQLAVEHLLGAT
jgi:hypothetical protein